MFFLVNTINNIIVNVFKILDISKIINLYKKRVNYCNYCLSQNTWYNKLMMNNLKTNMCY